jgi:hypothetical protein
MSTQGNKTGLKRRKPLERRTPLKARTELKRGAGPKRRTPLKAKVRRGVTISYPEVAVTGCWFARLPDAGPCDGGLVRCHLISKQLLKREFPHGFEGRALAVLQADPRSWVWGCGGPTGIGGHHGQLDHSRKLKIPRDLLPIGVEEMVDELGITAWLEREYGFPIVSKEAA